MKPRDVAIIGLAGGTSARQYSATYGGSVALTGVEIDPDIRDVAYRYFHLGDSNVNVIIQDGRYWLATDRGKYDVIVMDAYRQPYIPFHLTTREFFELVKSHLKPGGVAVVNAGRTPPVPGRASDYRLVAAISSTMGAVFPSINLVDVPSFSNTLVYGSTEPVTAADVEHNLALAQEPLVKQVGESALGEGNLRASPYHGQVYTDDLAPVERLIDQIIFGYVTAR